MATVAIDPAALDAARRLVAIAREKYPVVEAWLYGSHARGEAREDSDVDVAVVLDAPKDAARRMGSDLAADTFNVLMETGLLVSSVEVTLADWTAPEAFPNPFSLRDVRRDGVPL